MATRIATGIPTRHLLLPLALLTAVMTAPGADACTAFCVYRNGKALFGNNEDYWETDTKVWYVPKEGSARGESGRFGRVYFGFKNFHAQGGMNEAGLCFDGFATRDVPLKDTEGKVRFAGNLTDHVMAKCKNVDEVIALFSRHDLSWLSRAMLMFADRHGDSVIIEGDKVLRIDGDHQVVTNFYQSLTPAGKITCQRFKTARRMLAADPSPTVESCRDILAATHQAGRAHTQYSNVYDMTERVVHLYHFHDFEHVVTIDLAEELAKGAHEVDLPDLFPEKQAFLDFQETRRQDAIRQTAARRNDSIDPKGFPELAGRFAFDVGQPDKVILEILVQDRALLVRREGGEAVELVPEDPDRFFRLGDNGLETYHFQRDAEGHVTGCTIHILGNPYRGTKVVPPR